MEKFLKLTFSYIYKDISHLILNIDKCLCELDIKDINYTYLSILKNILILFYKDKNKLDQNLKMKNINDLSISKEHEEIKTHQNLLFIYHGLLKRNLIKQISYISFEKYEKLLEKDEYSKEDDNNIDNSFDENKEKSHITEGEEQKEENEREEENEKEEEEDEEDEEEEDENIESEKKKYLMIFQ